MATTSTIPTVKARLVTKYTTALATASPSSGQIQVTYAWPGPDTEREVVFLGYHPDVRDISLDARSDLPTIKAARKERQEDYTIPVTVWTYHPNYTPEKANECEARAFTIFGHLEDEHANDPRLGLAADVITRTSIGDIRSTLWPFQGGWACELTFNVEVAARLQ